jgi:hypothetical protein
MRCPMLFSFLALLVGLFLGCQSPEKAAIQPLPSDAAPLGYAELVQRGKAQVAAAHEFFYQDHWDEVKQAATALRDTSAALAVLQPDHVPAAKRADLATHIKELAEAAAALGDGAAAKDVAKTSDAIRRLHLVVRQLRPD